MGGQVADRDAPAVEVDGARIVGHSQPDAAAGKAEGAVGRGGGVVETDVVGSGIQRAVHPHGEQELRIGLAGGRIEVARPVVGICAPLLAGGPGGHGVRIVHGGVDPRRELVAAGHHVGVAPAPFGGAQFPAEHVRAPGRLGRNFDLVVDPGLGVENHIARAAPVEVDVRGSGRDDAQGVRPRSDRRCVPRIVHHQRVGSRGWIGQSDDGCVLVFGGVAGIGSVAGAVRKIGIGAEVHLGASHPVFQPDFHGEDAEGHLELVALDLAGNIAVGLHQLPGTGQRAQIRGCRAAEAVQDDVGTARSGFVAGGVLPLADHHQPVGACGNCACSAGGLQHKMLVPGFLEPGHQRNRRIGGAGRAAVHGPGGGMALADVEFRFAERVFKLHLPARGVAWDIDGEVGHPSGGQVGERRGAAGKGDGLRLVGHALADRPAGKGAEAGGGGGVVVETDVVAPRGERPVHAHRKQVLWIEMGGTRVVAVPRPVVSGSAPLSPGGPGGAAVRVVPRCADALRKQVAANHHVRAVARPLHQAQLPSRNILAADLGGDVDMEVAPLFRRAGRRVDFGGVEGDFGGAQRNDPQDVGSADRRAVFVADRQRIGSRRRIGDRDDLLIVQIRRLAGIDAVSRPRGELRSLPEVHPRISRTLLEPDFQCLDAGGHIEIDQSDFSRGIAVGVHQFPGGRKRAQAGDGRASQAAEDGGGGSASNGWIRWIDALANHHQVVVACGNGGFARLGKEDEMFVARFLQAGHSGERLAGGQG